MTFINPQGKILYHLDRVIEWENNGTTSPILFEIDPSNICNHNCPWCAFSSLRAESKKMLCLDMAKKILDGLKKMGVKAINWTGGGEPLVNQDLMEMIGYANLCGLDQGIFTNGYLFNDKNTEYIATRLDWIRFSIDSYDEESYHIEHGTPNGSFKRVIDNIKKVISVKGRCTVGYGFVMTENNFDGCLKAVLLAKSIGVDYIQLKPVAYRPNQKQISTILVKRMYEVAKSCEMHSTDKFKVIVADYRFQDMMEEENRGRSYKQCLSHHFQGAIGADSKVYLCDHHKGEKEYELGSLEENTMEEIWLGEKRENVIKHIDSTDLSQCQSCCRNHELNKFLWNIKNKQKHPNHI